MTDIRKAIQLIAGIEPTPQQVQHVQAIAHSVGIGNDDPMLPLLIVLDCYHGVFSEMPDNFRKLANDAANASAEIAKHRVDSVVAEAVTAVAPSMRTAMDKVAESAAQNAGGRSRAIWAVGAFLVALLVTIGGFGIGHYWGYGAGKADAAAAAAWMTTASGQAAAKAFQANPALAEWTGTKDAEIAHKLAKSGDLAAIVECSRAGWEKEKLKNGGALCVPRPAKDGLYGWKIPQ